MKSYFLLLRLNLRNLLAGFRGAMRKPNGKIDISRLILYPLALLGMLTLAGFVIFMEFSMFSAFEMLNAPEMLPGLAILLAMVTALLFSVFQMLAALYFSRDTASMAYLPLTSRTVLAAKWTEVYVSELLFSLLIAAPAVVLYGIHYAADWTYYLRMVPVLLAVNCIPLTISLLLASILGRFTSLTRHKEVWVVLGTVLMLVVVLGLEWSILPKIPEDADAAFFAQMLTGVQPMLRSFIHAFPPVAWAVDGIAGDKTLTLLYSSDAVDSDEYATLRPGDTGAAVRTMQATLYELGYYDGSRDGVYGATTQDAVRAFQIRNKVTPVDGIAGNKTLTKLYSGTAVAAAAKTTEYKTLRKGDRGDEVVQMQDSLQQLGYLAAVTGYYDDATVAAVRSFQSRNGLSVDGSAGQETLAVLYGSNPRAAY